MKDVQKPDGSFRLKHDERLEWSQVMSFWSAYARKAKRAEPLPANVIEENGNIVEVPERAYEEDTNVASMDALVEESTGEVLKNYKDTSWA